MDSLTAVAIRNGNCVIASGQSGEVLRGGAIAPEVSIAAAACSSGTSTRNSDVNRAVGFTKAFYIISHVGDDYLGVVRIDRELLCGRLCAGSARHGHRISASRKVRNILRALAI